MNSFSRTLSAVAVAVGLFAYIFLVESKKEPPPPTTDTLTPTPKREKVFTALDKAKVTSLSLKKAGGEVVHAEKNGESWVLRAPLEAAADATEINSILDALQNLETEDVVSETASDLAAFGLADPKVSVSVVVTGASKPLEFELGDSVPAAFGLFARVPGQPRIFTVSSTIENTLVKSAFDLRDRRLIKITKDDIQSLESVDKGKVSFRLVRGATGDDEWKIEKPLATRAARWTVDSFLGLVENLRMESIVTETGTDKDLAKYGLGGAARRLVLGLADSKTVALELGQKTADGKYYAREGSSTVVATIVSALVDDLDKGVRNLRAARLLDVAAYEITGLDVVTGGATRTFTKQTTKGKDGMDEVVWKSVAPVKDATQEKASDALFAIGGLDAAEFIDAPKSPDTYGLNTPALRVTIRFEAQKKEDWFEVAVKGDAGYGRRRDDTAVLKLDKAKTEALIKSFTELGS